jgi:serine/threonine protein kinase
MRFNAIIGRGAFGVVLSAFDPDREQNIAVKIVCRQLLEEASVLAAFEQECRIHESLCHPNIVPIYEIVYGPTYIYLLMELCSGGDLLDFIQNTEFRPLCQVVSMFHQILSAVAYLHARGIAHLDIKPENILIGPANQIKLADFGCCEAPPKISRRPSLGTLVYAAPEMFTQSRIDNRPADIWSLGILFFTLETGALPFVPGDEASIQRQILSGHLQFNDMMPNYILDIVEQCCQVDPDQRPTIDELMANELFRALPSRTGPSKGLSLHIPACLSFAGMTGQGRLARPKVTGTPLQASIGESRSRRNIGSEVGLIRPRQVVKPHLPIVGQPGRIKTAASVASLGHLSSFVPK